MNKPPPLGEVPRSGGEGLTQSPLSPAERDSSPRGRAGDTPKPPPLGEVDPDRRDGDGEGHEQASPIGGGAAKRRRGPNTKPSQSRKAGQLPQRGSLGFSLKGEP